MQCGVLGIHTRLLNLPLQEAFTRACQKQFIDNSCAAVVPLLTCNRAELYFSGPDLAAVHSSILACLREVLEDEFENRIYSLFNADCFHHLASVTCGLDSVVIGESDIQRQVKKAYEAAAKLKLCSSLHFLFQKSLKIAKEVRFLNAFPKGSLTLGNAIVRVIQESFESPSIAIVGNSDINRQVRSELIKKGMAPSVLFTRHGHVEGIPIRPFSELVNLSAYDVIISATSFSGYAVRPSAFQEGGFRLLFDLSMPRTIDPSCEGLGRKLYNLEHLGVTIEKEQLKHKLQLEVLQAHIQDAVHRHLLGFYKKQEKKDLLCIA